MFVAESSQQGLIPACASLLQGTFCQGAKPFWKRGTQIRSFELQRGLVTGKKQILAKEREHLHSEGETNQQAKALGYHLMGKEMLG